MIWIDYVGMGVTAVCVVSLLIPDSLLRWLRRNR